MDYLADNVQLVIAIFEIKNFIKMFSKGDREKIIVFFLYLELSSQMQLY